MAKTDAKAESSKSRSGFNINRLPLGICRAYSDKITTPSVANAESQRAVSYIAYGVAKHITVTATASVVTESEPCVSR